MLGQIEQGLPLYEQHRLQRETRQRALGGGHNFGLSLTIRVALVLSYLHFNPNGILSIDFMGDLRTQRSRKNRRRGKSVGVVARAAH
jgi:hypothetical protein